MLVRPLTRRRVLGAAVALPALGVLSACTSDDDAAPTPTPTSGPVPSPGVEAQTIAAAAARERDLLALYATASPELRPALQPYVDRHTAHLAILDGAVAALGSPAPTPPAPAPATALPGDDAEAVTVLATAETGAADAGVAALPPVGTELARVLASLAACEAANAALLRAGVV